MSLAELHLWSKFRRKYGPMHDVRRYDRPAAVIAEAIVRSNGGKQKMSDFMPWGKDPEPDLNIEQVLRKQFGGIDVRR